MENVDLWGGVECTCRRVGDAYSDQLARSGHRHRLTDLDRFAELGLRTLRYPVLWEHVAPESLEQPDWRWPDERLAHLQKLGIEPIVGLVHHGSGPRYTALDQPNFAPELARYAGLVAARYPWVRYYTPVNEPLTTARFSGLYGLWYPHATSDAAFVRMLYNQVLATRLAMEAIRRVNPAAQLVQTEDLGQAHCTPALAARAEFENHRRWLTFDLLNGTVTPAHPLWNYLREHGLSEAELTDLQENPCPPDILGINYYLTSERFLDDRLDLYPGLGAAPATPARPAYVNVEAVRVPDAQAVGLAGVLQAAWARYRRPLAVTELHLNCTREEQMRWLHQGWQTVNRLRAAGVEVRGLTVWSLLGAYDWDNLLTQDGASYESGVFDLRGGEPRPTALARMVQGLICQGHYRHPVLAGRGWWQRPLRFYPAHQPPVRQPVSEPVSEPALV
ncbi:glycoside hydrolase family 1 protein [Hymenobacter sp. ISL-91]|uniref:family 1 glycosylhydrolase n=1 Tax=Hymenobacter sp. ISL-91 TaxID=2819151 RepID=UPI001BE6B40B|nr:family 1 glycosylhydrolase [Hymenobacter sp. ISL-91]MBT2558229.1 glycoside hydrolase family 1 protein [Hymenobacter sp. ISL-91]